jgi:hypothetical protein
MEVCQPEVVVEYLVAAASSRSYELREGNLRSSHSELIVEKYTLIIWAPRATEALAGGAHQLRGRTRARFLSRS